MATSYLHIKVPSTGPVVQLLKKGALGRFRPCLEKSGYRGLIVASSQAAPSRRSFSTTPVSQLRDFFPAKDTPHIQTTPAAWPHHGYTKEEMEAVVPAHRPPRNFGDKAAWKIVRLARYCMDKATGMDREQRGDRSKPTTAIKADKPLTEAQWVRHAATSQAIHWLTGVGAL
jgi:hypothetical protein